MNKFTNSKLSGKSNTFGLIILSSHFLTRNFFVRSTICLSGYYVGESCSKENAYKSQNLFIHEKDQTVNEPPEESGFPGFSDEDDDDEDVHDLRYVSSDVEMPPDGLDMDSDARCVSEARYSVGFHFNA